MYVTCMLGSCNDSEDRAMFIATARDVKFAHTSVLESSFAQEHMSSVSSVCDAMRGLTSPEQPCRFKCFKLLQHRTIASATVSVSLVQELISRAVNCGKFSCIESAMMHRARLKLVSVLLCSCGAHSVVQSDRFSSCRRGRAAIAVLTSLSCNCRKPLNSRLDKLGTACSSAVTAGLRTNSDPCSTSVLRLSRGVGTEKRRTSMASLCSLAFCRHSVVS
jgi:hypothetical protein